ncbi:MAG TPA: peptidyl-prolyl cis-trans isomerase [Candidatus Saccharimonadales bacterium]|jgi:peptidyl-prolyl cis-trans isomerase D|nr:peptidyl-prolyl cis-trans isomerase [Candidatus Saccharimonadales bacterium]
MIRFLQSGNKTVKYLLGALLTLICLSMVVYLIPGLTSDTAIRQTGVVVTVAGEPISTDQINRRVQQVMQQQRQQGQVYPEFLRPYLTQQVVRQLVQTEELRYEANRMGLTASDQEIQETMRQEPYRSAFFPNGNWIGQKQYEDLLASNGWTVKEFENNLRFELLSRKLLAAVTAGVDVTPAEIERQYKDQSVKVKFDYAIIDGEEIEKKVNPTEGELKAWFEKNKNNYLNSVPEKRAVNYFVVSKQMAESKTVITADAISAYYNANQEKYRSAERIKTRHILVKMPPPGADGKPADQKAVDAARAKATDLLKQVKAGGDFAELAKKNSDDTVSAKDGGNLPWVQHGQFVPEFDKAAFAMNKGQTSDVVQSQFGFHIIQVMEKEEARVSPLSEKRAEIEAFLKARDSSKAMEQMANAAVKEAHLGLDQAAAKYGTQSVRSNPVARTDVLPGVGPAADLMNVLFSVPEKAGFQISASPQGVVVFEVAKIVPARTPAFEEVKDKVTAAFKAEQSSTKLNTRTQELADRARAAKDLRKVAKEMGLTVKTSELVGRQGNVPDIGAMSGPAAAAFNLKVGESSSPLSLGRKSAVLTVVEVQAPPLAEEFTKAKDGIREQLISAKRQQAMQLFVAGLEARMEKENRVKTNKSEMEILTKSRT